MRIYNLFILIFFNKKDYIFLFNFFNNYVKYFFNISIKQYEKY